MKWLEVGCPYCPAVLTLPSSASGRTIACPECGKNYLVPSEHGSIPKPVPAIEMLASQWIEEAGDKDDLKLSNSAMVPTDELQPLASEPLAAYTPSAPGPVASSPPPPPSATAQAPPPPPSPPSKKPAKEEGPWSRDALPAAKKIASAYNMVPEVDVDSPLPALEILPPPGDAPRRERGASRRPSRPIPAAPSPTGPAPRPTTLGVPDAGPTPDSAEVQLRMRRTQMRAVINLLILVVGTLLMTAFAFIVIHFSKRRK